MSETNCNNQLAICPFCGSDAEIGYEESYSLDSSYEYVGCTKCPAQMPFWGNKEETIKLWNARAENAERESRAIARTSPRSCSPSGGDT